MNFGSDNISGTRRTDCTSVVLRVQIEIFRDFRCEANERPNSCHRLFWHRYFQVSCPPDGCLPGYSLSSDICGWSVLPWCWNPST